MYEVHYEIPIRRAPNRPALMMGADRNLVIMITGTCVILASSANLLAIAIAIGVWFPSIYLLRRLAKADIQILEIYKRHLKYKKTYQSNSNA